MPAATNVTVTAAAEKFMRRMVRFSETPGGGLRLTVTPGGCSGLSSAFTVEPAPLDGDAELDINGLRLFLSAQSRLLLAGVTVDFADAPTQSGLRFHDPAQAACASCASSTSPDRPAQATVSLDALSRLARG